MRTVQIIGIGSRLMGDDGIGVYVVEELIRQKFLKPSSVAPYRNEADELPYNTINVEYLAGETDIDYCLNNIKDNSLIIIIDAVFMGRNPGTVLYFSVNLKGLSQRLNFSAHNQNVIESASRYLDNRQFNIIGIEPGFVGFKYGLSASLSLAYPSIIENVKKIISALITQ